MHVDLEPLSQVLSDARQLFYDKLCELYLSTFFPLLVIQRIELLIVLTDIGSSSREGPIALIVTQRSFSVELFD